MTQSDDNIRVHKLQKLSLEDIYYMKRLFVLIMASFLCITLKAQTNNAELLESYLKVGSTSTTTSKNIVSLKGGVTLLLSKVGKVNYMKGWEMSVEYDHLWASGWGIGVIYDYINPSYDIWNLHHHYIGPSLVYGGYLSENWYGKMSYGAGFSHCRGLEDNLSGLGLRVGLVAEYMATQNLGIEFDLSFMNSFFGSAKDPYRSRGVKTGISRLAFQVGLCHHF